MHSLYMLLCYKKQMKKRGNSITEKIKREKLTNKQVIITVLKAIILQINSSITEKTENCDIVATISVVFCLHPC